MPTGNHKKIVAKVMLAMLALAVTVTARAQHLQASLSHYSTDDGLPSNSIASLTSDDYGYLWIATWNGVSRFDGYNFYNYQTGIASGVKGLHNRIDYLSIDRSQNVWLKMYDGKLFVINRQNDRIEDPLDGIWGHEDYRIDYFYTPFVTSSGDVLVSFQNIGIYMFRLDRSGLKRQLVSTNQLQANCITEGYHGDLWIGTNKGVHRLDASNMTLEKKGYFLDEEITRITSNGYNVFVGTKSGKIMEFSYGQEQKLIKDTGKEITGLFVDSRGLMWYSDEGFGVYRINRETGDTKYFTQILPTPEFTSRGAEFREAIGVLWVRLNHGGYGYYNRERDEIEYFHNDPSNPWNLSNTVNAVLEMDNDGVIWESTIRRGLDKLEILKNNITRKPLVPGAGETLENEVRGMLHDKIRNVTLLANKKGKVFVYDKDDQLLNIITQAADGTPISRPYGIAQDSKGNYWVCDKDKGLFKITPTATGYNVQNFHHDENDDNSLSSNAAYQCVEDRQGNIWVATYGGGVNVLCKNKQGNYVVYNPKNVMKHYPRNAYKKVRTIALAHDGTVWAGTTDGILIMQIRNGNIIVEPLKSPEKLSDGLMSTDIVYLNCDARGIMWVGTLSGGLSCTVDKEESGAWKFKNYGIADGLPSEEIRSITFDDKGNVWFATDHVISSYNITKNVFTTFSNQDGVDDTMCSEGAAITLSDGRILFGTVNGYYEIDRKKLQNATGSLLKLRITDFYVNDALQSPRLTDLYDYYVPESKSVTLPHHGCSFAFRFAALNYQLQHRMHYQYKLEGYDDDWQNAGKSRMAEYSNVPSGKYHFFVKSFLLESPDAYDMRTIEVIVPPHALLSSTAVYIYLFLLVAGMIGGIIWYEDYLKKKAGVADAAHQGEDAKTQDSEDAEAASNDDDMAEEAILLDDEDTDAYEIIDTGDVTVR